MDKSIKIKCQILKRIKKYIHNQNGTKKDYTKIQGVFVTPFCYNSHMQTTQSIENINNKINSNLAVMVYFSAPTCNVCHALKPKLLVALDENFNDFKIESVDISLTEDIAPYFNVYSIPTVLIFLEGKEFLRKSRNMSVGEVIDEIKKPYKIMKS